MEHHRHRKHITCVVIFCVALHFLSIWCALASIPEWYTQSDVTKELFALSFVGIILSSLCLVDVLFLWNVLKETENKNSMIGILFWRRCIKLKTVLVIAFVLLTFLVECCIYTSNASSYSLRVVRILCVTAFLYLCGNIQHRLSHDISKVYYECILTCMTVANMNEQPHILSISEEAQGFENICK